MTFIGTQIETYLIWEILSFVLVFGGWFSPVMSYKSPDVIIIIFLKDSYWCITWENYRSGVNLYLDLQFTKQILAETLKN